MVPVRELGDSGGGGQQEGDQSGSGEDDGSDGSGAGDGGGDVGGDGDVETATAVPEDEGNAVRAPGGGDGGLVTSPSAGTIPAVGQSDEQPFGGVADDGGGLALVPVLLILVGFPVVRRRGGRARTRTPTSVRLRA